MFLAKFQKSQQVTTDKWDLVWHEKIFDNDATLLDVKEWYKREAYMTDVDNFRIPGEIIITEPRIDEKKRETYRDWEELNN